MNDTLRYVFRGEQGSVAPPSDSPHPHWPQEPEPYVAAGRLIQAVNLAIFLKRPLLLEGEAGCGKTRLARAVAHELGLPFYPWYVRSTSKAQEGLYSYDALLRLHDVHTYQLRTLPGGAPHAEGAGSAAEARDPRNAKDYRRLGPLGNAFMLRDRPAVVLIDEIDKADIDFPNDLLAVLDNPWEFRIFETGELVRASPQCRPIVIITSNKEKGNLPAPFLRRCIYHFVDFPDDPQRLKEIVDVHYNKRGEKPPPSELVDSAAARFLALRKEGTLHKNPGTSEFLDWLEALRSFDSAPLKTNRLNEDQPLPYPELLFKLRADWQHHSAGSASSP